LEILAQAMAALVPVPDVDKMLLGARLAEATALYQVDYTPVTWTPFVSTRNIAWAVYDKTDATQAQMDTALANLTQAMTALVPVLEVGKAVLGAKLAEATALYQADYTPVTWMPFASTRNIAWAVYDKTNATQAQMDTALANLTHAMAVLVPVPEVDKTVLGTKLTSNESSPDSGTPSISACTLALHSYASFDTDSATPSTSARTLTQNVYDNTETTQEQVDTTLANLTHAMAALVPVLEVDKAVLGAKLSEATALYQSDYTPVTWVPFVSTRNIAWAVYDKTNATQAQMDTALANLTQAMAALVHVPEVDKTVLGTKLTSDASSPDSGTPSTPACTLAQSTMNALAQSTGMTSTSACTLALHSYVAFDAESTTPSISPCTLVQNVYDKAVDAIQAQPDSLEVCTGALGVCTGAEVYGSFTVRENARMTLIG
jgi:vacuolar-type H+-ATPase subunit D/Vma8